MESLAATAGASDVDRLQQIATFFGDGDGFANLWQLLRYAAGSGSAPSAARRGISGSAAEDVIVPSRLLTSAAQVCRQCSHFAQRCAMNGQLNHLPALLCCHEMSAQDKADTLMRQKAGAGIGSSVRKEDLIKEVSTVSAKPSF